jgi:hypothetical protein
MNKKYVEFLKEIGKRTVETISDSDRMFLLGLFPKLFCSFIVYLFVMVLEIKIP